MLGAILAILSAASFALNNAAARRGVVTGTPSQGMALTVPVGVLCFLLLALVTGELARLGQFPLVAAAWMASVGPVHFLFGRYCNYRASQGAGTNLTAPVIQLQVIVTLTLAVVVLHEPCTALQIIGGVVMLAGAFITQQQSFRARGAASGSPASEAGKTSGFVPRHAEGYLFASLAALVYGTTPIMVRTGLQHAGPSSAILGGLIAYGTATAAIAVILLLSGSLRRNVVSVKRENVSWFVYSGVLVAMAQGFLYSAVAVAPIMFVMPLLQTSLLFRLIFALWLNPQHEVFGARVLAGTAISILGACTVSIDTELILSTLGVPDALARLLRWQV
jgi:drug/metabolite transporter (DMT)-like permease